MRYGIELTAKDVQVRVVVDASRWPTKVARPQAKEALSHLARAVAVAIESAPHVGTARELVDTSPVVGLDAEADRELGAPRPAQPEPDPCEHLEFQAVETEDGTGFRAQCSGCGAFIKAEPEKRPVAAAVGSPTWETMESYIRAVQLPPGTKLLEDEQPGGKKILRVRHGASGQVALAWVSEDRFPAAEGDVPCEVATVEADLRLDAAQVKERVLLAADQVLHLVQQRTELEAHSRGDGGHPDPAVDHPDHDSSTGE